MGKPGNQTRTFFLALAQQQPFNSWFLDLNGFKLAMLENSYLNVLKVQCSSLKESCFCYSFCLKEDEVPSNHEISQLTNEMGVVRRRITI